MANIIEITDFSAPELDVYARLTENQLLCRADPSQALFIAESPLVIGRALDAGCVPVSALIETKHIEGKASDLLRRCGDIPVYTAPLEVLAKLTGFHLTRGMLCAMRRPQLPTVEEVCATARRIAVLENVMNPTNVGAIFRSAAALGMDAVLLTSAGSDPLYRRASRVSMGNVFLIPWTYLPEGDWVAQLHALGFQTAAMALRDDSLTLCDPRLAAAEKLAGQIAGNAPIAVRASKQAINDGLQVDIDRAVVIEEKAFGSCFQSADQQEGMGAFLEKRKHEPFINK